LFPIHFPVTFSCECTSLLIFGMVWHCSKCLSHQLDLDTKCKVGMGR
jgi:hypothetical protein